MAGKLLALLHPTHSQRDEPYAGSSLQHSTSFWQDLARATHLDLCHTMQSLNHEDNIIFVLMKLIVMSMMIVLVTLLSSPGKFDMWSSDGEIN